MSKAIGKLSCKDAAPMLSLNAVREARQRAVEVLDEDGLRALWEEA